MTQLPDSCSNAVRRFRPIVAMILILMWQGCASRSPSLNQTAEIQLGSSAAVGLLTSLGENAQVPALATQYRLGLGELFEVQAEWMLPGWPSLGIKNRIYKGGRTHLALLHTLQYGQGDLGTNRDGKPIREHRIDLGIGLPASYRLGSLAALYTGIEIQLRIKSRGRTRFEWTRLGSVGVEIGKATKLRIECVGSWGAMQAYHVLVAMSF